MRLRPVEGFLPRSRLSPDHQLPFLSSATVQQSTTAKRPVDWLTYIRGFAPPVVSGQGAGFRLKAVFDFVGALMLLIVLSPVFLIVAAVIKLTMPGPLIFRQERLGWYRRPFMMWKFRTMSREAEQQEVKLRHLDGGTFFKLKNDPRVTRVGAVLRKYSLDELPQLINVLKGEMSLVGPRPIRDFEFRRFRLWQQLRRFSVKPGLTGIWQVNGRSNTSDEVRMQYDLQYVDNWSFLLDIKLLLKTIPAVLRGDGAV